MMNSIPDELAAATQSAVDELIAQTKERLRPGLPHGADLDASALLSVVQAAFCRAQEDGKDAEYCVAMAAVVSGWVLSAASDPIGLLPRFFAKTVATMNAEFDEGAERGGGPLH